MKQRKYFFKTHMSLSRGTFFRDILVTISSILLVLLATLYPFNFLLPTGFSIQQLVANFNNTSTFIDQVNNVLLFIPLGFSTANLLERRKIKPISIFIVILVSACLSLTVEVLQAFLPTRAPTPEDIINNSIGGFVGWLCYSFYNSQKLTATFVRLENSKTSQSLPKIIILFLGYLFLIFLISIPWLNTTNLSNWNPNYPLLIGNEKTGTRPWKGYISKIDIADKAISIQEAAQVLADNNYLNTIGDSLIASYKLTRECCYQDSGGKLPPLVWQRLWREPSINTEEGKGVLLSPSGWLETASPVTSLNKRIRKTSELTISTTVASSNTTQTGPARIISLSDGSLRRNFTLGQQGSDLDLRIRTSITGENGSEIKLRVPGVFSDTKIHHIVITYSKGSFQLYIDKIQNSYSFNLLDLLPKEQRLCYYAITFVPLGICLTLLTVLAKRKFYFYKLLLPIGILLPSLILESILVSESGKSISLKNLLLGIFFTTGTLLILRVRAAILLKKAKLNT